MRLVIGQNAVMLGSCLQKGLGGAPLHTPDAPDAPELKIHRVLDGYH